MYLTGGDGSKGEKHQLYCSIHIFQVHAACWLMLVAADDDRDAFAAKPSTAASVRAAV